ncbi:probable disease resistance protein At5g63020 isoform X5 [Citrus sinensis]|uniref:probable disease resistance protein At5g63020 isoform X5 n=1 Tax=Citrus sinensis TaxID=2711 RepID=UPI002278A7E8|nr:probable disease resistance protein At5g63020 isoform X5 [Citrus sinensis]
MGNLISTFLPADLFDRTSNCVGEQAKYVWGLEKTLRVLETELHKLTRARDDLKTKVEVEEQRPRTRRTNQVAGWLEDVQKLETEFTELERVRAQEMDRLCLGGLCSKNFASSYNYGTQVVELTDRVINLKKDEEKIEVVVEKAPDGAAIELPLDHTVVGQELLLGQVWRCITDQEKNRGIIGLYGIGGVGKTTLLKQVNNNFRHQQHNFDVVIWAAASTLQDDIGKRIGFSEDQSWEKKSPQDKAVDIGSILSRRKFVLLLDDIWKPIDLTQLGVPLQKLNDGSKVVLTTRSAGVCDQMDAEKVEVYSLAHDKAWELFQEMVDRSTLDSHTSIRELAETLARECGGLPLALKTVGRAMKSQRKVGDWKRAIHKMRTSASKFSGMKEEVFSRLKFSYDSLSTDELRSCLLYCCLYPEDYEIPKRQLIDYWISEGFVCDFDDGCDFIDDLLQACLLEEEGDDHVKMHDMIREMSLWIACTVDKEEQNFLVRAGVKLTEAPKVEEWEGAKRVSLMLNEIESLSEIPTCPRLVTFLLDGNSLKEITDGFFQSMSSLRVLSLSENFHLSTLPSGISSLVSLHHLDLSSTNITGLPQELKALEKLRYLNLDYTRFLSIIPHQLISGFSKLEVLRLLSRGRWSVIEEEEEGNVLCDDAEPLMKELLGLKHLNVLSWSFRSSLAVQKFLKYPKLVSITQSVWVECGMYTRPPFNVLHLAYMENLQELRLSQSDLEEMKIDSTEEVKKLFQSGFRSLDTVDLFYCQKAKDLTWLVFVQNLKELRIVYCEYVEEIIGADKLRDISEIVGSEHNVFAELEFLSLWGGINLKSVYPNPLPFPKLKKIQVLHCRQLKKLPLNSSSAKLRRAVIEGTKKWWEELQWEDQATQNAFSSGAVLTEFPFY